MKEMPWQDIYTNEQWADLLNQYRSGKIASKGKKLSHHIRRIILLQRKFQLPPEMITLTQQIQLYHNVKKQSIENLNTRAGLLRNLANTGEIFTGRNKIPTRLHQKTTLNEGEYKAYKKSLDHAVGKLARRARRKADYIDQLIVHVENADRGFSDSKESLLDYIKQKSYSPENENLCRMHSDVALEKIDPWHRTYEATFQDNYRLKINSGSSIFAAAFNMWIDDKTNPGSPFFVWLEGHYVCTSITEKRLMNNYGDIAYEEPEGHVTYCQSDKEIPAKLPFIVAREGRLWAYRASESGTFDEVDFFDTKYAASDYPGDNVAKGRGRSHAYVWSRDNFIFAGPHIGLKFHHSSFVSGKKVRCAGMIAVTNGQVTRVDNDSGHYKPGTRHLRNFVQYLQNQNVLTADAVIEDKSVKPDLRCTATAFLAGEKDVKAELNLKKLNQKRTTLREIVEERFQELKIELGQAPEHSLWIRAYKLVCMEFGEIEPRWLAKANAPAIPRDKSPGHR